MRFTGSAINILDSRSFKLSENPLLGKVYSELMMISIVSYAVSPKNGNLPDINVKSITPMAQTSS